MRLLLLACLLFPLSACATGRVGATFDDETPPATEEAEPERHGLGHRLLFYIPNRIFDVFDIVRARVRIGPGFGLSLRATELADINLAAYNSVWVGIHGPRLEPEIPWPFGLEALATAEVSVVGAEADADIGPRYGPVEFGLGIQLLIIGADVGVEPWELVDFVTGLITIDLVGDDY